MNRVSMWWHLVDLEQSTRVIDLGRGGGALPTQPCASHDFVTSDCRFGREAEAAGISTNVLTTFPSGLKVDRVLYEPPQRQAKKRVFELLDGAFGALDLGGSLYLAGQKNRGIESYRRRLEALFGNVRLVGRAHRTRVYVATKAAEVALVEPAVPFGSYAVDIFGEQLDFETRAGVFSWDGLDPGSRFLIESLGPIGSGSVLDVGAGAGSIGISLVRSSEDVLLSMVDCDALAVWCADRNIASNGLSGRANTYLGDLLAPFEGRSFDLIVSNPPFHAGNAVSIPLIEGAASHLAPGGRLALVVMREKPYLKALRACFRRCDILGREGPYTVLLASAPR